MNAPPTPASTHGHTVLGWLAEAPMTPAELAGRAARELGAAPHFHTCDCAGLSLDALLDLLARRGKIARDGDHWRTGPAPACTHA